MDYNAFTPNLCLSFERGKEYYPDGIRIGVGPVPPVSHAIQSYARLHSLQELLSSLNLQEQTKCAESQRFDLIIC